MNWTVETKKNNRTYELQLSAKKVGSKLHVEITVPSENPRGVRPIGWHESEIRKMLKNKGYDVDRCLKSTYVTNELANTETFVYTVKAKSTPKRSAPTRKSRNRTNKVTTAPTRTTAATKVESTDS